MRAPRFIVSAMALAAFALAICPPAGAEMPELGPEKASCLLCREECAVPIVKLNEAQIESIGTRLHEQNVRSLQYVDSLYRSGEFGAPGSNEARATARRAFKVSSLNSMDYVASMATGNERVLEFDEAVLERPFAELFLNPGVYPFLSLTRGRAGLGQFCMEYRIEEGYERTYRVAGRPAVLRFERIQVGGETQGALRMDYPSGLHDNLALLFESSYCGNVSRRVIVDRGDSLELILIEQLEGSYVRKWGTHRVGGFAYWRSIAAGGTRWREKPLRVGAAAYLPAIHLRLPFFLPDLGFQDVRDFDMPQPLWAREMVEHGFPWPKWMELLPDTLIDGWTSEGPRPELLDRIFPDL